MTVPPILLSIIVCEKVIVDRFSGMGYVNGIIQTIAAPKYPARHAMMTFFAELTNGHGNAIFTLKIVDVIEEDKEIFSFDKIPVNFRDVKQIGNIVFNLQGFKFPHEGEYRFQLFSGEHLLGERRIICRQIELPKGDIHDSQ